MRLLLALGLAVAFTATGPAGFAQTSSTGTNSVPTTSEPGFHFQGGASAKKGQYQKYSNDNGSVPTTSDPGFHPEGGASAKKGQYQQKQ